MTSAKCMARALQIGRHVRLQTWKGSAIEGGWLLNPMGGRLPVVTHSACAQLVLLRIGNVQYAAVQHFLTLLC